ncbi:hypothetical protein [Candidatus Sororendozoicomonas aggregata]|uniref:hypothetical protein n=1 Tax=Candidatus Sororendozoicomonas aggregata TaxID=3073239 RepID=UPI002ED377FF
MNEESAALILQKQWRQFIAYRKDDYAYILAACQALGEKETNGAKVMQAMQGGQVVVYTKGIIGQPLKGHSALFINGLQVHLMQIDVSAGELAPNDPLGCLVNMRSQYPLVDCGNAKGVYSHIKIPDEDEEADYNDKDFCSAVMHKATKGYFYLVHKKFTEQLIASTYREVLRFVSMPYSYGIHYCCHSFVANALRDAFTYRFDDE